MDHKRIAEANRAAWNAIAPVHRKSRGKALRKLFATPAASCLDETATSLLARLKVRGKRVAQLCCNNGSELLSICNLGAQSGVGFDISDAVIEEARELAAIVGARCTFVRADACDLPGAYCGSFDLVYVSVGALGWIADLQRFFGSAAKLLDRPGTLLVYEMHPLLDMYDPAAECPDVPRDSYFRREPFIETSGLDYIGKSDFRGPPQYWFHHKLSDIFTAVLANGFTIVSFEELEHDVSSLYSKLEKCAAKPPMSYVLTSVRP